MTARTGTGAATDPTTARRATWVWWGVAAGVLGLVGHVITDVTLTPEDRQGGAAVIDLLDRGSFHVGAVAGFLAVGCLLVVAAGWRRWSHRIAGGSVAAHTVASALTASAAAMITAYGVKGQLAVYLPGGINDDEYPREGLYTLFMINDLAPWIAWWGVVVAAAAVTWLALRLGALPRWIGVISALAVLAPLAMLAVTGITGFGGIVGPLWLIIVSAGLALSRRGDLAS